MSKVTLDVASDSFVVQDGEAEDLDVALVKRGESVTDEEEVGVAVPHVMLFWVVWFFLVSFIQHLQFQMVTLHRWFLPSLLRTPLTQQQEPAQKVKLQIDPLRNEKYFLGVRPAFIRRRFGLQVAYSNLLASNFVFLAIAS